jgi:ABC-type bacteriocin/lantibiotic exporter with double-glycine peptidase domain
MREKEGWCGPDVMQTIIRKNGKDASQSKLAEIMGTSSEEGTSHMGMLVGAIESGLRAFQTKGLHPLDLNDLSKTHHIIVNWIQGENDREDGHYSVYEKYEDGKVYLHDAVLPEEDFNKLWYDYDRGRRVDKWALLIKKS